MSTSGNKKKRKAEEDAAAAVPSQEEVKAQIRQHCAALGRESFAELKKVAMAKGVQLNEKNRAYKHVLCAQLATKFGLGVLETMVDVVVAP